MEKGTFDLQAEIIKFATNFSIDSQEFANNLPDNFKSYIKENSNKFTYSEYTSPFGADPEFFIVDKKSNIIPAFDFLGDKNQKENVAPAVLSFADGFGVEYNFTTKGETCRAYFIDRIQQSLKHLFSKSQEIKGTPSLRAAERVERKVLKNARPDLVVWGCEPTANAYKKLKTRLPNPFSHTYRYGGGHIHLSITNIHYKNYSPVEIVKGLDRVLGLFSVLIENNANENLRRRYYGLPGEYRLQAYGLEYRTLSNYYYKHPSLLNLIIDIARRVPSWGVKSNTDKNGNNFLDLFNSLFSDELVIQAIRTGDKELAWNMFKKVLYLSAEITKKNDRTFLNKFASREDITKILALIHDGPEVFFRDWYNIQNAWRFDHDSAHNTIGGWEDLKWNTLFNLETKNKLEQIMLTNLSKPTLKQQKQNQQIQTNA